MVILASLGSKMQPGKKKKNCALARRKCEVKPRRIKNDLTFKAEEAKLRKLDQLVMWERRIDID